MVDDAATAHWRCEICAQPMIQQNRFREDPEYWRRLGYRCHAARKQCRSCYHRVRRGQNSPARPAHDRAHVIAVWRQMSAAGASHAEIADRLDITRAALNGLLKRARRDGLIQEPRRRSPAAARSEQLDPDELARLRAAVGLPAVLPSERAS